MSGRLPACTAQKAISALKRAGWHVHHVTGSHYQMRFPGDLSARVTIPMHRGDLKRGTLRGILKQAGLSEGQFRELLRRAQFWEGCHEDIHLHGQI